MIVRFPSRYIFASFMLFLQDLFVLLRFSESSLKFDDTSVESNLFRMIGGCVDNL